MSQADAASIKEERPFRNVRFGPTDVVVERKPDGTAYVAIRDVAPSEVLVLNNRS